MHSLHVFNLEKMCLIGKQIDAASLLISCYTISLLNKSPYHVQSDLNLNSSFHVD